ncbi:MAG: LamG domain-containing protein [Candidatus Poribacteria bacterium]|nr:LamG domain-containing protein [Candidatus Poribacteria bacterium]
MMKKLLFILGVVCFSLIAVHISTAEIDLETAVGIWLFDEGKGDVAGDLSGQGNDGELMKSPKWVKGKFGSALEFDGKASCVSTGQKLLDNLEEFTIITWVQTTDTPVNRTGLVGQNDSPEFGFITAQAINLWTPTAGGTQKPWEHKHGNGEWHHVGCVATTEYVHTYIDGEYVEKKGGWANHGTSAFNVNIGGCGVWDPAGNFFPGLMDEVAIFHSALEQEDIQELMDKGFQQYLAVDPAGKLGTTWGHIKATHHFR